MKKEVFKKLSLVSLVFRMEGLGWLGLGLGFAGLGAALGLLAVSGWFIAAAGMAALHLATLYAFNFLQPAALIRLLAILRTAALYGERIVSHDGVLRLLSFLRLWLFDRLGVSNRFHLAGLGSGNLMQGMLSDIDLLDEWPIRGAAPWIWAFGLSLSLFLFSLFYAPALVPVFAVFLVAVFGILPLFAPWKSIALAGRMTEQAARRRQFFLEGLSGLLTLKTTGTFREHFRKFQDLDRDIFDTGRKLACHQIFLQTLILASLFVMLWFLLGRGGETVSVSNFGAAVLVGLVCAILGMAEVLLPLARTFQALGFTLKARERLLLLGGVSEGKQAWEALPEGELRFEVKDLSVRQEGALAGPENVSFSLFAGDVLWVDGPSGCGKTTLALALSGWLSPERGDVFYGGISLSAIREWDLRQAIGFLEQTPHLFSMTLGENLRLGGKEVPEETLWEVLDLVFLGEWARELPMKLETPIAEYGKGLSGGQARRLALARLLLFSPKIFILDEPFEGLDEDMAKALLQRLVKRQERGILVIISHQQRLKTVLPEGWKPYAFTE